jgi:hypothetical protein
MKNTGKTDALPTVNRYRVSYHHRGGFIDRGSAIGRLVLNGGQKGGGERRERDLRGWHG